MVCYFEDKCTSDELNSFLKLVNQKHLPSVVYVTVSSLLLHWSNPTLILFIFQMEATVIIHLYHCHPHEYLLLGFLSKTHRKYVSNKYLSFWYALNPKQPFIKVKSEASTLPLSVGFNLYKRFPTLVFKWFRSDQMAPKLTSMLKLQPQIIRTFYSKSLKYNEMKSLWYITRPALN